MFCVLSPPPQLATNAGNSGVLERCLSDEWHSLLGARSRVSPPRRISQAARTCEAQLQFRQEGNPASWRQPNFPCWTLILIPTTSAVSLVTPTLGSLGCDRCCSCGSRRARCQLFASQREKKGKKTEMSQGRQKASGDTRTGQCPLPTSCQVPLQAPQSPLNLDGQPLPTFPDFPGFEVRVVKAEKAGAPGSPSGVPS